jgi:signal transduction histidine kinase
MEKSNSIYNEHTRVLNLAMQEADSIVDHIEYLGKNVKELYSKRKAHLLSSLSTIDRKISSIMIIDNNGKLTDFVSKSKNNIYKGYDYSSAKYFKAIKNGAKDYWSEVYLSYDTNTPSISYSIRVSKKYIAVVVMNLNILNKFTEKFKNNKREYILHIASKNGQFLSYPNNPLFVSQRRNLRNTNIYEKYIKNGFDHTQLKFLDSDQQEAIGLYGISKKLGWYIIVQERYDTLFKTFNQLMLTIALLIVGLLAVVIYFSLKLSKSILKPLDNLNESIANISSGKKVENIKLSDYVELNHLAKNFLLMQKKIKAREDQNREQDKKLHDNVKMVQMGEMIGNIAHQWRQPLSVISTASSGMKAQKEFGVLTDEIFFKNCDLIVDQTLHLSKTIDIFRDFIKEKKDKKEVVLQERLDSVLEILSSTLQSKHIKLINNIDYKNKIYITMVLGELSQVIINILNNAKDIIVEKNITNPAIEICCEKKKDEGDQRQEKIEGNGSRAVGEYPLK